MENRHSFGQHPDAVYNSGVSDMITRARQAAESARARKESADKKLAEAQAEAEAAKQAAINAEIAKRHAEEAIAAEQAEHEAAKAVVEKAANAANSESEE